MSINLTNKVYLKLLKEMAIITPSNFLEKIIKLCNEKPQLLGDPSIASVEEALDRIEDNLFKKGKYLSQSETEEFKSKLKAEYEEKEASRQKSVEIRKSKGIKVSEKDLQPITLSEEEENYRMRLFEATAVTEKNIILEIIKIVQATKLLELKGKQNKKKLKQAEEVLIQQIRKHRNIDGENIEFKKVLPMFDSILNYIDKKVDVSLNSCIQAADLYMRIYYDMARKEEKDKIDKGNFDFSIIMDRINFVKSYKKKTIVSGEVFDKAILKVYEDDNMLIVYPTTYPAFCYMIDNKLGIDGMTWCTYRNESDWIRHSSYEYVAIAHAKKSDMGDEEYAISLKVTPDGVIDVNATCDFNNDHVDRQFLFEHINKQEMIDACTELPNLIGLGVDTTELEQQITKLCELNDVNELKSCFSQSFAFAGVEQTMGLYEFICTDTPLSREDAAEVVVDSISFYLFGSSDASAILHFRDFFNISEVYPSIEIYNNLKSKILNQRSHPRYFNTFLKIEPFINALPKFSALSYEEFKKALLVAADTNNVNNLKRILKLLLESGSFRFYLNPYKIQNKSEGLTQKNLEIYDILINSQGVKSYISDFGINAVGKIQGKSYTNTDVFMSRLIFRFPEKFVSQIKEESEDKSEDPVTRIDLNLVAKYIAEDARNPKKFLDKSDKPRRFLSLDKDFYEEIKESVLEKHESFKLIKNYLSDEDARALYRLIGYNMENGNIFNISYDLQFDIFSDLTTFKNAFNSDDYFINFPLFLEMYNKKFADLHLDALRNITEYIDSHYSNDNDLLIQEKCRNFFNKAILDSKIQDDAFKYTYEIFKILSAKLKFDIIIDSLHQAEVNIDLDRTNINSVIQHIQNKSKVFMQNARFVEGISGLPFDLSRGKLLILSFMDFIPIEERKTFFSEFVSEMFGNDRTHLASTAYANFASSMVASLDLQIIGSKETIDILRRKIFFVTKHYGKMAFHTRFINTLIQGFTENNKAFPKDIMQKIAIDSTGQNYNSAEGIKNFFKNFVGISEDGSSHLYGKELSIVRETLKELFRNRQFSNNKSMFGTRYSKEIAFEIVQKMGKHARMHMAMAFPDEATNLRANTPEEDAELQVDSLIRRYIKMLLS